MRISTVCPGISINFKSKRKKFTFILFINRQRCFFKHFLKRCSFKTFCLLVITYLRACAIEGPLAGDAFSCQEFLITGAGKTNKGTGAVQGAHVDVQGPHVVTDDITIHWKVDKNRQILSIKLQYI